MISRYIRKPMEDIWSEESKFNAYLAVEIANAKALLPSKIITPEEYRLIVEKASFSIPRIEELEAELKHDIIAFTRSVSESLGDEKRFIHYGLTSTDVVDTAYAVRIKQANEIIQEDIMNFMEVLKEKAMAYQDTVCIGRTHGIHADITVFGLKWALWYDEMKRNLRRFVEARKEIEVGKISGAVGNYAFTDPQVEVAICEELGIGRARVSTQTLQRDRHAHYVSVLALIGATLEKIATEIRHLQRTEVSEAMEPFGKNQKGSSAMPHKKNPITSENICGLARVLRGYMIPAFEDVALWHERDISHSSVERIIIPDATGLLDYMLNRYTNTLKNLIVFPNKMEENILKTNGIIFSQRVLTALINKGYSREMAYDFVQPIATQAYVSGVSFLTLLKEKTEIQSLFQEKELEDLFTYDFYKRNVKYIYDQVFI